MEEIGTAANFSGKGNQMLLGTHAPKLDEKGRVILPAKFREEDVIAGKNVSGAVTLKQIVDKLNKHTAPKPNPDKAVVK